MSTSIIFPMIRNFFNIATGFTSPVKILLSGSSTETCTDLCITCPKTLRRCQHTWLGSITDSMHINLSKLWGTVEDRGTWHALVYGVAKWRTEERGMLWSMGLQSGRQRNVACFGLCGCKESHWVTEEHQQTAYKPPAGLKHGYCICKGCWFVPESYKRAWRKTASQF